MKPKEFRALAGKYQMSQDQVEDLASTLTKVRTRRDAFGDLIRSCCPNRTENKDDITRHSPCTHEKTKHNSCNMYSCPLVAYE